MRTRSLVPLLAGSVFAAGCGQPVAPVPAGYVFPVRDSSHGSPTALLLGVLTAEHGCIYVRAESGTNYLVVWPDTLRLVIDASGVPALMRNSEVVARVGDRVQVTGGESAVGLAADARQRCPGTPYLGVDVSRT